MKAFEVWSEGYAATGEHGSAQLHGIFVGETFRDAVENCVKTWLPSEVRQYYNAERLTYWGCRFFDNETDARKLFG